WVMFGGSLFVCTLAVLLPLVVLAQAAFAKAWGRGFGFDNLTWANFYFVLVDYQTSSQSLINTLLFSDAAAQLRLPPALAIAYIVHRKLMPFGGVLSFLCLAPFVVPGIVLAIGFYAAYASRPLLLYGTAAIMILAFTTRFLPIAYANSAAAIR